MQPENDPDLAPETVNAEQEDADSQAQTLADEALGRGPGGTGLQDSEKVPTGREDNDEEGMLGEAGED